MAYFGSSIIFAFHVDGFRKMKKFTIAIIIGILVVVAIAYMDTIGLKVFSSIGMDYTSGEYPREFWTFFFNMSMIFMAVVAVCYYFLYRNDKSEAFAVFLTPYILWQFGLADILYFWLQGKAVPATLSWLDKTPVMGNIAKLLGNGVTNISLYISVAIGFVAVYFITKFLKERV